MMSESLLSCCGAGLGWKAKLLVSYCGMSQSLAATVQKDRVNEVEPTGCKHGIQGHSGVRRH